VHHVADLEAHPVRKLVIAVCACALLLGPSGAALAQSGGGSPSTDLTFAGGMSDELTGSDANACVFEDGDFRGRLAAPGAASILSFDLTGAAVGTYPVGESGNPKLSMVTLSDDPDEFLVNWYGQDGSLTIASLDVQVPVAEIQVPAVDGPGRTKGASGSIDADVAADNHGTIHISGTWACHLPF
jgi:hypothetical protein